MKAVPLAKAAATQTAVRWFNGAFYIESESGYAHIAGMAAKDCIASYMYVATCNEQYIDRCILCSPTLGVAEVFEADDEGELIINERKDGLVTKRIRGDMQLWRKL